jgi:hypothetical protein
MSLIRRHPRFRPDGTVEIPLTKGKVVIIDIYDLERVCRHNWYADNRNRRRWYAVAAWRRDDGTRTTMQLHRFLVEPPPHMEVDHIDGDGLHNCRSNLRLATRSQNSRNSKRPSNNTSGRKGVHWDRVNHKWRAQIGVGNHKTKALGRFYTKEEAAQAYDKAAIRLHGEFARINGAFEEAACH